MKYSQCVCIRTTELGEHRIVTYLPVKYAESGNVLKLKFNDTWVDGWKVVQVGASHEESDILNTHSAVRLHRKHTGDSLPK